MLQILCSPSWMIFKSKFHNKELAEELHKNGLTCLFVEKKELGDTLLFSIADDIAPSFNVFWDMCDVAGLRADAQDIHYTMESVTGSTVETSGDLAAFTLILS